MRMSQIKLPTIGTSRHHQPSPAEQKAVVRVPTLYDDMVWSVKVADVVTTTTVDQTFAQKAITASPPCLDADSLNPATSDDGTATTGERSVDSLFIQ
jgi:hypothetical protein